MICPNCSHENEGGKFCVKCGTPLKMDANSEVAATSETAAPTTTVQPNRYIESTKKISKTYFSYFMQVLKQPYASSQGMGAEHFINGLITMIIYSFLIPLTTYFGLKSVLNQINPFGSDLFGSSLPFSDVVLKPTFAYLIFILLVAIFTFAAIRLGRVNASFKEVIARFGSFLIPTIAIFVIGLLMAILAIKMFFVLLIFGFIGSVFLVPPLVIASFKKETKDGIDIIYGSLITYALIFIAAAIMGDMLFNALQSSFYDLFSGL